MYLLFNRSFLHFCQAASLSSHSQVCISSLISLDYLYKFRNELFHDIKLRFTVSNYACCFVLKLVLLLCQVIEMEALVFFIVQLISAFEFAVNICNDIRKNTKNTRTHQRMNWTEN